MDAPSLPANTQEPVLSAPPPSHGLENSKLEGVVEDNSDETTFVSRGRVRTC